MKTSLNWRTNKVLQKSFYLTSAFAQGTTPSAWKCYMFDNGRLSLYPHTVAIYPPSNNSPCCCFKAGTFVAPCYALKCLKFFSVPRLKGLPQSFCVYCNFTSTKTRQRGCLDHYSFSKATKKETYSDIKHSIGEGSICCKKVSYIVIAFSSLSLILLN